MSTTLETIIAVKNVPLSAEFYRSLFALKSEHGGETFEILKNENHIVLCLHKWGEHDHPTMISSDKGIGNGLILFFRVTDLNRILGNAYKLMANIEQEIHYNKNSLKNQFILRDPDGYYIIVSE